MAMMAARAFLSKLPTTTSRFIATSTTSPLLRFRTPILAAATRFLVNGGCAGGLGDCARCYSTQPTNSSLRDSSPNWSNRPPKETILLDGCDFEHWLVVMEPPPGNPGNPDVTREEIIQGYIQTLAQVVGSEEEARMKIYSVSTKHYFAFGALVSEELSYKLKELPKVRWVLPDSYLDVQNKDYGGEPFINGQAVPYDPKYHEEWVRNNARANDRSRRNDRPRNFDRSRNFERRRENMQNFQNSNMPPHNQGGFQGPPPGQSQGGFQGPPPGQSQGGFQGPPPGQSQGGFQGPPPGQSQGGFQGPPPGQNQGGFQGPMPGQNRGGFQGPPPGQNPMPNMAGHQAPPPNMGSTPPPNMGGANYAQGGGSNYQGGAPAYQQGAPAGYPGDGQGGYPGGGRQGGAPGTPYQGGSAPYQGGAPGFQGGGNPSYQGGGGGPPNYGGGPQGYQGQGSNPNLQQGGSQGPPPPGYQGNYQ